MSYRETQEAKTLARYERERRQRAEAELARIADVISRANSGVERNGRDMYDWLAQVLQVLVLRAGVAEAELVRARDPEGMMGLTVREVADQVRESAGRAGMSPAEWATAMDALTPEQIRLSPAGRVMPSSDKEYLQDCGDRWNTESRDPGDGGPR